MKRGASISRNHAASAGGGRCCQSREARRTLHYLYGFAGFLKITRRQQMNAPVNARIPGAKPRTAHSISVRRVNLPKCNSESQNSQLSVTRSAGSKTKKIENAWGNTKYVAEKDQIRTMGKTQNPSALCKSQLNRGKCVRQSTRKLRCQYLTPGHHMIAPVKQSNVRLAPPMPFTVKPIEPAGDSCGALRANPSRAIAANHCGRQ